MPASKCGWLLSLVGDQNDIVDDDDGRTMEPMKATQARQVPRPAAIDRRTSSQSRFP